MPSKYEDRIVENLTWLRTQQTSVLAVALVAKVEKIDAGMLEPPRQRLLDEFVDILACEIFAMAEPDAKGYIQANLARLSDVIGGTGLIIANETPLTKQRPDRTLKKAILKETTKVALVSGRTGTGEVASLTSKWAESAFYSISKSISFASWHMLLLCYAHFLICMLASLSSASDIPQHTKVAHRLSRCLHLMRELHKESDAQHIIAAAMEAESAYENQMLGGFIYRLGYDSGTVGMPVPVKMFQQTPNDGNFGDLVVGNTRCFAIEFKRDIKSIQSEKEKWTAEALTGLSREPNLISASLKCHLLCYGKMQDQVLSFASQLYATAIGVSELVLEMSGGEINSCILGISVDGHPLVNQAMGLPPLELENYLRSLAQLRDSSKGGDKATWLALATDQQRVFFRVAPSLASLIELVATSKPKSSLGLTAQPPGVK